MLFSSVTFLLFFLPSLFICYFVIPQRFRSARNMVLMLFSLFFYAFGGPKYLILMIISVAINYIGGLLVHDLQHPVKRKWYLAITIALNLLLLGWFKYAGFFSEIASTVFTDFPIIKIALPIGISFYTFQSMSYVIDVYRGETKVQKNPFKLMLYIALFPQLIAGPIVRYVTVAEEIDQRTESVSEISEGLVRFMIGFGKKMILANAAGEIADAIFGLNTASLTVSLAWIGALAYAFQIYFDFSAYSDMAIGLGRVFGFHFLENFNYPYIAKSVTDFWRRWHISLSTWFRDYVYIPLGGNRQSVVKHIRNIAVVWFLTGMWHGAAWNFILWGMWFCIFLIGEKYIWGKLLEKAPAAVNHLYTLLVVLISWVFFRSPDLSYALSYTGILFGIGTNALFDGRTVYYLVQYWPEWLLFGLASVPLFKWIFKANPNTHLEFFMTDWVQKAFALFVFGLGYMKLVVGSFNPFIYFRF